MRRYSHSYSVLLLLIALSISSFAPAFSSELSNTISTTQKEVTASTLDEEAKQTLLSALDVASKSEANAIALRESAKRNRAEEFEQQIASLKATLNADPSEQFDQWRATLTPNETADVIETALADLRADTARINSEITDLNSALAQADQRPSLIAQSLQQLRQEADELESQSLVAPNASLSARVAALGAQAGAHERRAKIDDLLAERSELSLYSRSLELKQRSLQRQLLLNQRKSVVLEAELASTSTIKMDALGSQLRFEADQSQNISPIAATEADRNISLGNELANVQAENRQASEQLRQSQQNTLEASDALRNTQARLALKSTDESIGLILINEHRRAMDPQKIQEQLSQSRQRLAQVQLRLIDLNETAATLSSPESSLLSLVPPSDDETPIDLATTHALRGLFETRSSLVTSLSSANRDLLRTLTDLEASLARQLEVNTELNTILNTELLWFPSHERIGKAWFARQVAGWKDLFKPSRFGTSTRLLRKSIERQWPIALFGLVVFFFLFRHRQSLAPQLEQLAKPLLRVRSDRYTYTLQALAHTLLGAMTWALPFALSGWLLRHAGESGKFSDSLGQALLITAGGVMFYQFLKLTLLENGLAQKHFRWTKARRDAIEAALPWFAWLILPLQFILSLAYVRGQEPAVDAVARLMLLLICIVGSRLFWNLLAPGAVWTFRGLSNPEPSRARRLLRLGFLLGFVAIALLTLNGYVLTATTLIYSAWLTLLLIMSITVTHSLVSRWFLLGERRLTLNRLEARKEAAGNDQKPDALDVASKEVLDPENDQITIQSVNQQTRSLLRAATITLMVFGLLWVWSGILPALDRLDTVSLLSVPSKDASGQPILASISLGAVLGGIIVLILTFVSARNLPGLVEIFLQSRGRLDSGTRYAVTNISRYLIVFVGTITGLGMLGIQWNQLQWLAAAFTVGLGFGLQEIFANFISGLIILFERPYRVGDTVTINDVEGTVTRIQTRATTVLDASNREVIVPNRLFITSRFVNWTLSDTVTRLTFKLNFPNSIEPEKVRQTLLDIASSEPLVLKQPAPNCWLTQISSGGNDYELQVFVGELSHRNRVKDQLNRRIVESFEEANISS